MDTDKVLVKDLLYKFSDVRSIEKFGFKSEKMGNFKNANIYWIIKCDYLKKIGKSGLFFRKCTFANKNSISVSCTLIYTVSFLI